MVEISMKDNRWLRSSAFIASVLSVSSFYWALDFERRGDKSRIVSTNNWTVPWKEYTYRPENQLDVMVALRTKQGGVEYRASRPRNPEI